MDNRSDEGGSFLERPSTHFSLRLSMNVSRRNPDREVHGAFPVVIAPKWRQVLLSLAGPRRVASGTPYVAAGVGPELWLYSCGSVGRVGEVASVHPAESLTPLDRVDLLIFAVGGQYAHVGIDWFDEARMVLARIRRCAEGR